jgi:hypothetical protein
MELIYITLEENFLGYKPGAKAICYMVGNLSMNFMIIKDLEDEFWGHALFNTDNLKYKLVDKLPVNSITYDRFWIYYNSISSLKFQYPTTIDMMGNITNNYFDVETKKSRIITDLK